MSGETSTFECAHQLGKLCENRHLVVNLIPYNQTDVKDKLSCPTMEHIKEFQRIVVAYGVFCTIRTTMGADISGACGQLIVEKEKSENPGLDIEDLELCNDRKVTRKVNSKKSHSKTFRRNSTDNSKSSRSSYDGDENMLRVIKPLVVSTTIMASCCVVSIAALVWLKKRK